MRIHLRYNPNIPGDRERAWGSWLLNTIAFWAAIGIIVYYFYSLVKLLLGQWTVHYFISSGIILAVAVIAFFCITMEYDADEKKLFAKIYFIIFFGSTIDLSGITAIIVSIWRVCHRGTGTILLICSILGVITCSVLCVFLLCRVFGYRFEKKTKRQKENLPSTHEQKIITISQTTCNDKDIPAISNSGFIYCRKCGKKLPSDSCFCSSCGTKVEMR